MEDDCLREELYHFFGRSDETPSKAAFYHQRTKLKDGALWELLQIFNQKLKPTLYRNRYRLVACDGSVADIFRDEKDTETIFRVLIRFVPEDEPLPDEVEAIRRANENIKEYGTISHDAIDWD